MRVSCASYGISRHRRGAATRYVPASSADRLQGRVAIVTGGAEGIGRGIADVLAEQGASVGILAVNAERGVATADEISSTTGMRTFFAHCDVADEAAVERAVADVVSALGAPTILVN